jgi:hypothetical protein
LKFYQEKITIFFFFTPDFENALLEKGGEKKENYSLSPLEKERNYSLSPLKEERNYSLPIPIKISIYIA